MNLNIYIVNLDAETIKLLVEKAEDQRRLSDECEQAMIHQRIELLRSIAATQESVNHECYKPALRTPSAEYLALLKPKTKRAPRTFLQRLVHILRA